MNNLLSVSEMKDYLNNAEFSFRHQECATCECYLGYVAQLEIDSDQEGRNYLKETKPDRDQIHACLGCDPCAPGILYTTYLRRKTGKTK